MLGGIRTPDPRLRRPLLYPTELQTQRAGDGNRTHVSSLEGWCSTIELHPHDIGVTGFEPATSWSQTRRSSQAEPHPVNKVSRFAFNPFALDAIFIILHCFRFVNTFFHFFSKCFLCCFVLTGQQKDLIISFLICQHLNCIFLTNFLRISQNLLRYYPVFFGIVMLVAIIHSILGCSPPFFDPFFNPDT